MLQGKEGKPHQGKLTGYSLFRRSSLPINRSREQTHSQVSLVLPFVADHITILTPSPPFYFKFMDNMNHYLCFTFVINLCISAINL